MTRATLLCLSLLTGARLASAQRVGAPLFNVALDVAEPVGGAFEMAFSSALRSLGDVNVVNTSEGADYVLRVIVTCNPREDCAHATTYFAVLEIARPLHGGNVRLPLQLALAHRALRMRLDAVDVDQVSQELYLGLSDYEVPKALRLALWGQDEYRIGIKEFVARFDHECLESDRIEHRALAAEAAHDTANAVESWREESRAGRTSELCTEG